jgi:hypothetical protein
MPKVIEEIRHF